MRENRAIFRSCTGGAGSAMRAEHSCGRQTELAAYKIWHCLALTVSAATPFLTTAREEGLSLVILHQGTNLVVSTSDSLRWDSEKSWFS